MSTNVYYSTESVEHKVNIGEMNDPIEDEAISEAYLDWLELEELVTLQEHPHIEDY